MDVLVGDLRIATSQTAARTLVLPALARLHREHPGLRVHLSQEEPERALPALLAHDHDLVLAEEYPSDPHPQLPGLQTDLLTRDALRLATEAGAPTVALSDLLEPQERHIVVAVRRGARGPPFIEATRKTLTHRPDAGSVRGGGCR